MLLRGAAQAISLLDAQVEVVDELLPGRRDVVGAAGVGGVAVPGGDEVGIGVFVGAALVRRGSG
ncbi:hypothetical protein ACVWXU_004703 [Streptomyces sp. TE33382]